MDTATITPARSLIAPDFYRHTSWDATDSRPADRSFYADLARGAETGETSTGQFAGLALAIYREALADQRDRDHETALQHAPSVTVSPSERDAQAAQAQAELLGANAEQRAKLRAIVQERHDAQARVAELELQLDTTRNNLSRLQSEPISARDERLLPIWEAAAREANTQGYCSVYDQIASTVGAPTRDELDINDDYVVTTRVTIEVSATVTASDSDSAWDEARRYDWGDEIASGNYTIHDENIRSVEREEG